VAGDGRGRATALLVSVVLAAIAGYVDAVGFGRLLGVFPANQSGNVIFLGMAIGGHGPTPGWRTATAIVCFGLGAALGYVAGRRLGARRRGPVLLGSELVVLLVVVAISGPLDQDQLGRGFSGWTLIALTSAAMGVQTEAIRHVAGVAIATTYESGALVRIGEVLSAPFRQGREARYAKPLGVLVGVLLGYLGGAAFGASTIGRWEWSLLVPCAVLAVFAVSWSVRPRWFAAIEDDHPPGDGQAPLP
jgi:uncharacterized membrane protein YoaK (UPF0700 family)